MQCREVIDLHSKECYADITTKLKEEEIMTLNVKSNTHEWVCIRRFSFISTTVHTMHVILIRMIINHLEELGFDEVHLNFIFD